MIKDCICCSKEDYSFYVKCDCGREIIQFYFYEDGGFGEPLIGISYFGHINNPKSITYDRSVVFSVYELPSLIQSLLDKEVEFALNSVNHYFTIKHNVGGFIHLIRAIDDDEYKDGNYLWDITIHETMKMEVVEHLIDMLRYINEKLHINYTDINKQIK